jgi:glyoxylase-like metal-dependent hydrolase (beta-lactamase superfamily II)
MNIFTNNTRPAGEPSQGEMTMSDLQRPEVRSFFDPATSTVSHVIHAGPGTAAAIVDSVLDYDPKSGRTDTHSADAIIDFVQANRLSVEWHLETHIHADHLSAAPYLKSRLGGHTAIGSQVKTVQKIFRTIFNAEHGFATDGSQFDHQFEDDEHFRIGDMEALALHVPGHTPADFAFLVGDAVFVGDTLFMPDVGTARCDFPGGSAHTLWNSAQRLLSLPAETRLFLCHDYPPPGRAPSLMTTIGEERRANIHLHEGTSEAGFVAMREARDATLAMPVLLLPSVQVNMRAGHLPPPEADGVSYLKIPINRL